MPNVKRGTSRGTNKILTFRSGQLKHSTLSPKKKSPSVTECLHFPLDRHRNVLTSRKSLMAVAVSVGCGSMLSTRASHAHPCSRLCGWERIGPTGRGGVWIMAA